MIAIKCTAMNGLPECCDDCTWFATRPYPFKGWTDGCELMNHCLDDDQPEEWIYDGEKRPTACPLVELAGMKEE